MENGGTGKWGKWEIKPLLGEAIPGYILARFLRFEALARRTVSPLFSTFLLFTYRRHAFRICKELYPRDARNYEGFCSNVGALQLHPVIGSPSRKVLRNKITGQHI